MVTDIRNNARNKKTTLETAQAVSPSMSNKTNTILEKKPAIISAPPSKDTSAQVNTTDNISNLLVNFNSDNLVQGFIMSEILGSPKAKKWRGNTLWNSRF